MSDREPTTSQSIHGSGGADRREDSLRALIEAAYPSEYPSIEPSGTLRQRVAESASQYNARGRQRSNGWLVPAVRIRPALCAVATALLLALLGLTVLIQLDHGSSKGLVRQPGSRPTPPASYPAAPVPRNPHRDRIAQGHPLPPRAPVADLPHAAPPSAAQKQVETENSPHPTPITQHPIPTRDDLVSVNGYPGTETLLWTPLARDERDKIEDRVRRDVRVRDDFVQIPFPRLVDATNRQVAAAVESYKREAAIVDPRLSREVTLASKATALSDLCDRLRADTGIRLEAGRSVADEKVTVFCEKLPLRDVMRQLGRPFGYTWLRSGAEKEYRYELVQDLRSQLLEEELRNRDRNAALLALEREIERYRPYLGLSPEEALARAKTAAPAEKNRLERLASTGWGPLQIYFRLSPQELAALRAGEKLKFSQEPKPDERPLPAGIARGVLDRWRQERFLRHGDGFERADAGDPHALPLIAIPEARGLVTLALDQSELGRFTFNGGAGFRMSGLKMMSLTGGGGPLAVGESPRVLQPENRRANAASTQDPALRPHVSLKAGVGRRVSGVGGMTNDPRPTPNAAGPTPDTRRATPEPKVTSADVLEALHRACGLPIVADYYTRLYPSREVTVQNQPLFDALNSLADTMHLRWSKEGGWLQFRSTSYYDDRLKEVPNRLLAGWAASRKAHGVLKLEDLMEIAQLSEAQLQAEAMAEGARELFGLEEWDLARRPTQRPHLRYLTTLTLAQRQAAQGPSGLPFTKMSLAQQQEFISFAFVRYSPDPPTLHLEDLAGATLRVEYAPRVGFEWKRLGRPQAEPDALFPVRRLTPEAALQAALQVDPQASPAQIAPAERALTFAYLWGRPEAGLRALALRATDRGATIWGPRLPPTPDAARSANPP